MNKHEMKGQLLDDMKHSVVIIGQRSDIGEYPQDLAENMAEAAYSVLNQHISTLNKINTPCKQP